MKRTYVYNTWYWQLMCWWTRLTRGNMNNLQVGTAYHGGVLLFALFFDGPGERAMVAQTSMTKEQARHFYEEMGRQLERFDAFGPAS